MAGAKSTTVALPLSTLVAEAHTTIPRMETLGDRLRYLRHQNKDTQLTLADIAGVTKQAISKIERVGVIDSASSTLEPIARRYGVSLRWLMTGTGPMKEETAPDGHSQAVRLDPRIIRVVARALQEAYAELGRVYSITDEPELFAEMYERTVARGMTTGNLVWLGARIKGGARRGTGDERGSNGTHGEGHGSGTAGRSSAKA